MNKCTIATMKIIINVKSFLQRHSAENRLTFMKKAVFHATNLMHCKDRQVLRDLRFSTNQRNGSEITFSAGTTKSNLKNLKI